MRRTVGLTETRTRRNGMRRSAPGLPTALVTAALLASSCQTADSPTSPAQATVAFSAHGGHGAPQLCTGIFTFVTVEGDVVVPEGEVCDLGNSAVTGDIRVGKDAGLTLRQNTTVAGSVLAEESARVGINDSFIEGDVQAENVTGDFPHGTVALTNSRVGGSVRLEANARVSVRDNGPLPGRGVAGDVQLAGNGSIAVFDNDIGGNLQCEGNGTADGDGNDVGGQKTDQCQGS